VPTVLRAGNMVVRLYAPPREHPPPHVHVTIAGRGEAVVRLGEAGEPPTVLRTVGLSDRLALRAWELVHAHQEELRLHWEKVHGP